MKKDLSNLYVPRRNGRKGGLTQWNAYIRYYKQKGKNTNSVVLYVSAPRGQVNTEIRYNFMFNNGVFLLTQDDTNGKKFSVQPSSNGRLKSPNFEMCFHYTVMPKSFIEAMEKQSDGKLHFFVTVDEDNDIILFAPGVKVPNRTEDIANDWK